jgi:hypothetical protein
MLIVERLDFWDAAFRSVRPRFEVGIAYRNGDQYRQHDYGNGVLTRTLGGLVWHGAQSIGTRMGRVVAQPTSALVPSKST